MERADAPGGEWQDLSEPHEGRVCDHRHPLEWTQILWVERQTVEGICTMNARSTKVVRCAIYTRVSTDQGLEQDFNSLDAQYDASQAYIRSQTHAGWSLLRAKYEDGGFFWRQHRPAGPAAATRRRARRQGRRDRRLQGR